MEFTFNDISSRDFNIKIKESNHLSIPKKKLEFIEGPVYVIMCYNLHYSATEPGEKANPDFINELMDKMEKIPGIKDFAVASGGFDWREDGQVTSIDEIKAEELIRV